MPEDGAWSQAELDVLKNANVSGVVRSWSISRKRHKKDGTVFVLVKSPVVEVA